MAAEAEHSQCSRTGLFWLQQGGGSKPLRLFWPQKVWLARRSAHPPLRSTVHCIFIAALIRTNYTDAVWITISCVAAIWLEFCRRVRSHHSQAKLVFGRFSVYSEKENGTSEKQTDIHQIHIITPLSYHTTIPTVLPKLLGRADTVCIEPYLKATYICLFSNSN